MLRSVVFAALFVAAVALAGMASAQIVSIGQTVIEVGELVTFTAAMPGPEGLAILTTGIALVAAEFRRRRGA